MKLLKYEKSSTYTTSLTLYQTTGQSRDGKCRSFNTARRTLRGYEAMNMIRKGQINQVEKGDIRAQAEYARSNFRSCGITSGEAMRIVCPQAVFATQPNILGCVAKRDPDPARPRAAQCRCSTRRRATGGRGKDANREGLRTRLISFDYPAPHRRSKAASGMAP